MKAIKPLRPLILVVSPLLLYWVTSRCLAETPAAPLDPNLLSSPSALCFATSSPEAIIDYLETELKSKGYAVIFDRSHRKEVWAIKSQKGGGQDRFLVWLGRDLNDCGKINIFVQYGRFEEMWFKSSPQRVRVDGAVEKEKLDTFAKITSHLFLRVSTTGGLAMTSSKVRSWIAIIIIGVFMVLSGIMALFPLFVKIPVPLEDYTNFFIKIVSVYTGIVGVVIGYYFGRLSTQELREDEDVSQAPNPGSAPDVNRALRGRRR